MTNMRALLIGTVIFAVTTALGAVAIAMWVTGRIGYVLEPRVPGRDRPAGQTGQDVPPKLVYEFAAGTARSAPQLAGNWQYFRGKYRDGISDADVPLARSWPPGGPRVLWAREVGEGHAGPAVLNGRVYLHDYDVPRRRDVIRCMSLADGNDIWTQSYRVVVKRNHGMSRATPAVTDRFLVAMGPKCHTTCLDSNTGKLLWSIDMVREYGTVVPAWYSAQCPLIEEGKAILAPGGRPWRIADPESDDPNEMRQLYAPDPNGINPAGEAVLMMAVDCATGKVLWRVPNDDGWMMTHSSIARMEMEDRTPVYVYCGSGGVVGVSVETGKVLWKTEDWKIRIANVPTPLPVAKGKVFLSGGYAAGCAMLQIAKEGEAYVPKVLWRLPDVTFGSEQQTPVFYKEHIFGVRPDGQFICLGTDGTVTWSSGPQRKFGECGGPYLVADDLLFAFDDAGLLRLLKATPESYQQLAEAKVLGHHSYGPMAVAGSRLLCRDLTHLVCLDVGRK